MLILNCGETICIDYGLMWIFYCNFQVELYDNYLSCGNKLDNFDITLEHAGLQMDQEVTSITYIILYY